VLFHTLIAMARRRMDANATSRLRNVPAREIGHVFSATVKHVHQPTSARLTVVAEENV
jgi:hypothetical protein